MNSLTCRLNNCVTCNLSWRTGIAFDEGNIKNGDDIYDVYHCTYCDTQYILNDANGSIVQINIVSKFKQTPKSLLSKDDGSQ